MQLEENHDGKCFIITKDDFNVFDLAHNKLVETLNFNKLLASLNNNEVNSSSPNKIDFNDKSTSNPIKICSDVSKIDPNQVISNFPLI